MRISYTLDASHSLASLVHFIEDSNTKGAGLRWLKKYEAFLKKELHFKDVIGFCHNLTLKKLKLKCIQYNDWVIAFSESKNSIIIEAILHRSRIRD